MEAIVSPSPPPGTPVGKPSPPAPPASGSAGELDGNPGGIPAGLRGLTDASDSSHAHAAPGMAPNPESDGGHMLTVGNSGPTDPGIETWSAGTPAWASWK
eukprot:4401051-Heterocapsa_arctica.AAC.1